MSLEVRGLVAGYGKLDVLHEIDLDVPAGECVCVVGANGAGKSTLLNAIAGLIGVRGGEVRFEGEVVTNLKAHALAAKGLALVPEGRHLFATLSARENLDVARRLGAGRRSEFGVEEAFELFPALVERADVEAGRLSGGEQQMLAIARALMLAPGLIMLDEPSIGLAPTIVAQVMDVARGLVSETTSVLLVEQNIVEARRVAGQAYVLDRGRIVRSGEAAQILDQKELRKEYLGV
jgi:branched-chain amino acid transport system ATP-binding protein